MKMFKGSDLILCLSAILLLPHLLMADDDYERLEEKYNKVFKFRDSGVYEDGEWLFVHVKEEFNDREDNPKKKRMFAVAKSCDLLKQWAIDYTAADRDVSDPAPDGVKAAKKIISHYLPDWQFREWPRQYSMHEIPYTIEGGKFVYAQAMKKLDVVKCIPAAFTKPFAADDWDRAIVAAVKKGIESNGRDSVAEMCGAWDAVTKAQIVNDKEYKTVQAKMDSYFAENEDVATYARFISEQENPTANEYWRDLLGSMSINTNETQMATTNVIANVVYSTNVVVRAQTAGEIRNRGRSSGSKVSVESIYSDEESVDETTTITVVERRKIVRRREVTRIKGMAEFERMFVSKVKMNVQGASTTSIGDAARKMFFSTASVTRKEQTIVDALRENPRDAKLWNLLGKCLQTRKDYFGAVNCFRKSLMINGDYEFALVNLAETYSLLGYKRLSMGLAIYARALAKDTWCIEHSEKLLTEGKR